MGWFSKTEDYDISSSKLDTGGNGGEPPVFTPVTFKDADDEKPSPPSSDTGRDERERGHTNFSVPDRQR